MCDRDLYMTALYLVTSSASLVTSGIFVLVAMGNIQKRDTLKERNEITKKNQPVLPTNISVVPPKLDAQNPQQWKFV